MEEGDWLIETARNLYKSFANAKDECPDIIAQNFVTILCRYPLEVIRKVCDPHDGIAGEQTWVASPKELREACEKRHAPILREQARLANLERQMRGRREDEAQRRAPKTGTVKEYLASRMQAQQRAPASAATILRKYNEERARYGGTVSLSPEAAAIIARAEQETSDGIDSAM